MNLFLLESLSDPEGKKPGGCLNRGNDWMLENILRLPDFAHERASKISAFF